MVIEAKSPPEESNSELASSIYGSLTGISHSSQAHRNVQVFTAKQRALLHPRNSGDISAVDLDKIKSNISGGQLLIVSSTFQNHILCMCTGLLIAENEIPGELVP